MDAVDENVEPMWSVVAKGKELKAQGQGHRQLLAGFDLPSLLARWRGEANGKFPNHRAVVIRKNHADLMRLVGLSRMDEDAQRQGYAERSRIGWPRDAGYAATEDV
jgi:hypothetical protein